MREIKFRVWDKVLNKMITQENVIELLDKINSEEWETGFPYSSDEWYPAYQILGIFDYFNDIQKLGIKRYEPSENRFEIMQYTGLKDKNAKEIYEGDIVFIKGETELLDIKGKVEYSETFAQYIITNTGSIVDEAEPLGDYDEMTVIGNVWKNSDLLKGE